MSGIPILLFAVIVVVRALGGSHRFKVSPVHKDTLLSRPRGTLLVPFARLALFLLVGLPLFFAFAGEVPPPLPLLYLALWIPGPCWTAARLFAIPLGLPRTAWLFGWLTNFTWRKDRRGGGLVAGILAATRRGRCPAWLRRRIHDAPMTASGTLAAGLLADLDGDRPRAFGAMVAALHFDPRFIPREVHRIALLWCATELAAAGQWKAIVALPRTWRTTPRRVALLTRIAARLSDGSGSRLGLWLLWLWAPDRRRSYPLLRRALAAGNAPARAQGVEDAEERRISGEAPGAGRR